MPIEVNGGGNALWAAIATGLSAVIVYVLRWLKDTRSLKNKAQAVHDAAVEERALSNEEAGRKLRDELRADLLVAESKIERLESDKDFLITKNQEQRLRIFDLEATLVRIQKGPDS